MTKNINLDSIIDTIICLLPVILIVIGMYNTYPACAANAQEKNYLSIEVVAVARDFEHGQMTDERDYISYTTADGERYEAVLLDDCPTEVQKIVERKRANLERKGLALKDCVFGIHSILNISNLVIPDSTI